MMIRLLPYVSCRCRGGSRGIKLLPQWGGIVLFFLLVVFTTSSSYAQTKKLKIVSTIKPIQLLVNGIVGEHAKSALLIPASMNLHHYSLRPSDLRKLTEADMVIRISENMEMFLNPLLGQEARQKAKLRTKQKKRVISLSDAPEVTLLPVRDSHGHSHHEAQNANDDYHIWLDPYQAELLANYIAQQLSLLDPEHAESFKKNNEKLKQEIRSAHHTAQAMLLPLKGKPYLVFHDSWRYFEHTYGLAEPHIVSLQEDLPPGVRTIYKLRQDIISENINCLIVTPNSNKKIIATLIEDLPINTVWLSPSGDIDTTPLLNDFPSFIRHNAEQFSRCIQSN